MVEALEAHPGSSADRLYDLLVSRMVRRGEFERHNFQALLEAIAEPVAEDEETRFLQRNLVSGNAARWYLHATAGDLDAAERTREDAAAARLEVLMHRRVDYQLEANADEGVHYSDRFEHYLPVKEKPRRLLQAWLPEYFHQTSAGAWRPPLSDEERTLKQTLRAGGALRRIKRFVHALAEGVPPALPTPPTGSANVAAPLSMPKGGRSMSRAASTSAGWQKRPRPQWKRITSFACGGVEPASAPPAFSPAR